MKKKIRNLLKCTSLSTALFVFQACYGMPPGYTDPEPEPETTSEMADSTSLDVELESEEPGQ